MFIVFAKVISNSMEFRFVLQHQAGGLIFHEAIRKLYSLSLVNAGKTLGFTFYRSGFPVAPDKLSPIFAKTDHVKKQVHEFELTEEYIELIKLLKLLGIADTGSDAKQLVDDGDVKLNNQVEYRRRAKLRSGDQLTIGTMEIKII